MKISKQCQPKNQRLKRLPVHVYLAYLLVCTLLLTGVSFSRYISSASGRDNARVAAGVVTVRYDDNTNNIEMIRPSNDGVRTERFNFSVSNGVSEVAIRYDVVVTLDQALKNGVTMQLDDGTGSVSDDKKTYTFPNAGTFEAGVSGTKTHTLSFAGDFDTILPGTDDTYQIEIAIRSQQID